MIASWGRARSGSRHDASDRERIDLEAPLSGDFQAVVRLIIGGIAERVDFAFEEIDDLQLAVERLLAEAGTVGQRAAVVRGRRGGIRTRVGPLSEREVAEALRDGERGPGELTLRRILQTVVDSFGVEEADDGRIVVRLEKLKGARREHAAPTPGASEPSGPARRTASCCAATTRTATRARARS